MGSKGGALFFIITATVALAQERSLHWVPHVTHEHSHYRTAFLMSNPTDQAVSWLLTAYKSYGSKIGQWSLNLAPHETRVLASHELFQDALVSHFSYDAPSPHVFRLAYFAKEPHSRDGFLFSSENPERKFVLLRLPKPGEFIGLAMVNTGSDTTTIRVRALDASGELLHLETLVHSLPSHAKALRLLEGTWLDGALKVLIEADEKIAVTTVIGPSNHDTAFLLPVGFPSPPGRPDNPIEVPDPNFQAYLVDKYGDLIHRDGVLTQDEANLVTEMGCDLLHIQSLEGLAHFPNLEYLTCSSNDLESLPDLSNLHRLRELHCSANRLTELPRLISQTQLTHLVAVGNLLTSLPELNLPELAILDLRDNQLSQLPKLNHLHSLERLWLNDNQLESLPEVVSLNNLESLQADHNRLSQLPDMSGLVSLEDLDLRDNQLAAIHGLTRLPKLEDLDISENQFQRLPDLPESIARVSACCNQISSLPSLETQSLPNLYSLDLTENSLTNLQPLVNLPKLQYLYLSENWITNPAPLLEMRVLWTLTISHNLLNEFDCPTIRALEQRIKSFYFSPQRDGVELDCGE